MQDERRGFGDSGPRRPRANGKHSAQGKHGTNGVRPDDMRARPLPFHEAADEPIDLMAVQADDELINALAAGMTVSAPGFDGYDNDDKVAALLAAWRADVDAEPLPELVDLDTATATVLAAARPANRGRIRHLVPVAAAAAMVVFTIGGLSIGAHDARPGDTLWGVSRVLYSERAESLEAVQRVETNIAQAKDALTRGEPAAAAEALAAAEEDLQVVRVEEGQAELAEVQDFLEARTAETEEGERVDLDSPLTRDPQRRVPPGAGTHDPREPHHGSDTTTPSPGSSTTDPSDVTSPDETIDPRFAPGPSIDTTTDPETSTDPGPGTEVSGDPSVTDDEGEGEGGPDDDPTSGSATPSGTTEGDPDPTTTTPGQSMGSTDEEPSYTSRDDTSTTTAAGSGSDTAGDTASPTTS